MTVSASLYIGPVPAPDDHSKPADAFEAALMRELFAARAKGLKSAARYLAALETGSLAELAAAGDAAAVEASFVAGVARNLHRYRR